MPRLPNEILDGIWLERCNLGFEPRILQEKWINVGHMRLPAFYVAQPQAFMTQLCHGAREVAAKGFYSRVFDNPSTGDGGFWWNKDDVLYIDMEFYRELHPSRKALILGRDKITRVALEIQIDEDSTTIVQLILDWFPNVSRVFSTGSARLFSSRDVWAASDGPQSEPSESAITKSVPIKGFYGDYCPKIAIPGDLFVRVQGLTGLLNKPVPAEHRARLFEEIHHYHYDIRLYVFNRSETHGKLDPNGSPCEDRTIYFFPMTLKHVENGIGSDNSHLLMCNVSRLAWWNTHSEEQTHMDEDVASTDSRDDEYSHDEDLHDENFSGENLHDWSYDETSHNASDDTYLYDQDFPPPFWQQPPR